MSTITGGPAFPVIAENGLGHVSDGLSLRDYFAAKAMAGMIPMSRKDTPLERYAETAYALADAMIAEREKGTK